ncbi:NAD(P)-binding protein [Exidia glandulosa HHB12029]|uniref:NAD(P)-binding protein n=1 Tax=Exidia glandulosa HHB12029 TaxID=1314781 RepID=A0A165N376_EXIGL|nr:NAD(P)-binding protein [Exidia glandulosa HHB12029]
MSISATVLVTGANGFIATWLVGDLLQKGYTVRAAVRSDSKAKHLRESFGGTYGGKLSFVFVGNMVEDGAWDEAVKGVDAIVHMASPVGLHAVEPSEYIDPAVKGATGILESALKHAGAQLKRVVITSSCAAVLDFSTVIANPNDDTWNERVVRECEEKGREADPLSKYSASKVLAEKAVWKFYETHKTGISWDITTLCPPWVFGPSHERITKLDDLPPSGRYLYDAIVAGSILGGLPSTTTPGHGFIDVRDVSLAHVRALETPAAGGERILIVAGSPWVWQDFIDAANALNPQPYTKRPLNKGDQNGEKKGTITFDTSKERRILGLRFRTMEEIVRDMLVSWAQGGI